MARNKPKKNINKEELNNIFISANSNLWRQPSELSINQLQELIGNSKDSSANVISYEFKNQDKFPELSPDAKKISPLEVATDGVFLYVWFENRWKRAPLSEF